MQNKIRGESQTCIKGVTSKEGAIRPNEHTVECHMEMYYTKTERIYVNFDEQFSKRHVEGNEIQASSVERLDDSEQ